jgi:hypothetical protein
MAVLESPHKSGGHVGAGDNFTKTVEEKVSNKVRDLFHITEINFAKKLSYNYVLITTLS